MMKPAIAALAVILIGAALLHPGPSVAQNQGLAERFELPPEFRLQDSAESPSDLVCENGICRPAASMSSVSPSSYVSSYGSAGGVSATTYSSSGYVYQPQAVSYGGCTGSVRTPVRPFVRSQPVRSVVRARPVRRLLGRIFCRRCN